MIALLRVALTIICAALVLGAALFSHRTAWAGSCCGGSGGTTLVMPKYFQDLIDMSFDTELYNGFWNQNGKYTLDPPGSDLRQYRLNLGYAHRFAKLWQASVSVAYVWNSNQYSGLTSHTDGPGDTMLNVWYEALDDISAWRIRNLKDLTPSIVIGPSLLVPTGISPYDNVHSSFDVTGRGFYRLDGNVIVTKTLHPWSASLTLAYGTYLERSVNEEYGRYVEPYHKKLGNRGSACLSASYIFYPSSAGDTLTATASLTQIREADATINGARNPDSGFRKDSVGATLAYSSTDHDWSARFVWNHAIREDGWGENFPCTDIYTVGVSYGFR